MREKLFAGVAAVGIYLAVIALLFYYFGYHHGEKPTHFVEKNTKGIAITLAGPSTPRQQTQTKKAPKPKPAKPRPKTETKKPPVKKRAKKAPSRKPVPKKKPDTKKLFSKVKTKPVKKTSVKRGAEGSRKKGSESLKKSTGEQGVENAYLAKVQNLLKGWPAQANFAGEEIDIRLKIYPDGHFDYKILRLSGNPDFNHQLIGYLKQLQRIGFGPHRRKKPYDIEVQFIAHE
ncbi:TonB C-terminal domain-containing protein [Nitratifractor sp.]